MGNANKENPDVMHKKTTEKRGSMPRLKRTLASMLGTYLDEHYDLQMNKNVWKRVVNVFGSQLCFVM